MRANYWSQSLNKRIFDFAISLLLISSTFVIGAVVWIAVKLTSRGPAFFRQQRVGLDGRLFTLYKFRTMASDCDDAGPGLTCEGDTRLTPVGRALRKLKLDEIPQFYNVLRGDMSLVGPRPKLPQYSVSSDWQYRPGITGLATLAFRWEEQMLKDAPPNQVDAYYEARIKPMKARLDRRYMRTASFSSDLRLIWLTATACVSVQQPSRHKPLHSVTVSSPARTNERPGAGMLVETDAFD